MKQNEIIVLEDEFSGKIIAYYRNIIYIKSDRHYLYYYLQNHDKPIKIRGSINAIESCLEEYDFARIHRSIIINLKFILSIDTKVGKIHIQGNSGQTTLSLSNSYKRKSEYEIYSLSEENVMKNVAWNLFEILINIYQGIVAMYFSFKYLSGKYSDKFIKILDCLFLFFLLFNNIHM